ncbi:MAG: cytochrome c3 family protein [Desulfurivibrionaceae bacterium]
MAVLACPGVCLARVSGPCVNCHTMHNSQGGSPMAYTLGSGGVKTYGGRVNAGLLNTDCVGCHQGANAAGSLPFVLDTGSPNYGLTGTEAGTTTLAGGNFHWVSLGNDRAGHNVSGITAADATLGVTPPGGTALGGQLTCAGTLGCHGSSSVAMPTQAVMGGHHSKDMTVWQDGTSVAKSYRFLNGIQGLEDSLYELQPTASRHNKYYGKNRTSETDTAAGTISSLCARCHGNFHDGSGQIAAGSFGAGVWLRHPVDFDMSRAVSSTEYTTYNSGTGSGNPYSVIAPVATNSTTTVVNSTVDIATNSNNAIVMCLSCHRAHGTPYDAILRWNYKQWPQTGGYNGCAVCHTTKN